MMSEKSGRKFARSLRFESDSTDSEPQFEKKMPNIIERRRKKRKYPEECVDNLELETKSEEDDVSTELVQTVCSELKGVLSEKTRYFQTFVSGAKNAFESKVKNLQTFCSNQQSKCNQMNTNVASLNAESMTFIENSRPKEHAVLNAMRELLEAAKEKRQKLKENMDILEKIHEAYMKEMNSFEDGYTECSNDTRNNLNNEFKNIQRNMIQEMQRKTMKDMRQNVKEMYSKYSENPTSRKTYKMVKYEDSNYIT